VVLQGSAAAACKILLTGGVHGDEPGGVEAALRFVEGGHREWLEHFSFSVVPCVSPTGYVRNTRENHEGVDLNRAFEEGNAAEVRLVKDLLRNIHAGCFVDFHEDWEAKRFYLYEGRRNGEGLGPEIIRRVEGIGPIDPNNQEDEPLSRGVYGISPEWGTKGLVPYALKFHVPHALIFETPTEWAMDKRAEAHLAALDTVLQYYRDQNNLTPGPSPEGEGSKPGSSPGDSGGR